MLEQIKNTIKLTTDVYLGKFISKVPDDKKSLLMTSYETDINRISKYFYDSNFFNDYFQLTEIFLK